MCKLTTFIFFLFITSSCTSLNSENKGDGLFNSSVAEYNFGEISDGEEKKYILTINNFTDDKFEILDVKTSCNCIMVNKDFEKLIESNGKTEIELTFKIDGIASGISVNERVVFRFSKEPFLAIYNLYATVK